MKGRFLEPPCEADDVAWGVIGAAIQVHRTLGPGFLESIYEEALCLELAKRRIRFDRQTTVTVDYEDTRVGSMRLDLLVGGCVIVELKCVEELAPIHRAQLISYLRASNCLGARYSQSARDETMMPSSSA